MQGRSYTLSGYINTGDISTFSSGSGVYLAFLTCAQVSDAAQLKNVTAKSEIIDFKTSRYGGKVITVTGKIINGVFKVGGCLGESIRRCNNVR